MIGAKSGNLDWKTQDDLKKKETHTNKQLTNHEFFFSGEHRCLGAWAMVHHPIEMLPIGVPKIYLDDVLKCIYCIQTKISQKNGS